MTLLKHELSIGKNALLIWSGVIAALLAVCVLIYPQMESQMNDIGGMFSEMGGFSAAFGMDRINFGEFDGYFGVECGNILGLGGAFFAAMLGISSLAKEEQEQTAEFLFTHPVSRIWILLQKYVSILLQILFFHAVIIAVIFLSIKIIGEEPDLKKFALLFLSYMILQIETASVCFCLSAFLSRSGMGIGFGIAALFYFLNIIANLIEEVRFLKYLTPFGYTDWADISGNGSLKIPYLLAGIFVTIAGTAGGFYRYCKKDIY